MHVDKRKYFNRKFQIKGCFCQNEQCLGLCLCKQILKITFAPNTDGAVYQTFSIFEEKVLCLYGPHAIMHILIA